ATESAATRRALQRACNLPSYKIVHLRPALRLQDTTSPLPTATMQRAGHTSWLPAVCQTNFAAFFRFGSGPMCWVNGTPGPLTCGVPVFIRILRIFAGDNGAPFVFAMPWRHATAPVTMGEALEVPEKRWVYQRFSLAPPCASPYPQVVTCQPQPCTLTILP